MTLRCEDRARAARIRDRLRETGYDEPTLERAFGSASPASPQLRNRPRLLYQSREPSPFHVAVRLCLIGEPVESGIVARFLGGEFVSDSIACGLARLESGSLVPEILVAPVGEYLVGVDRFRETADSGGEYILPVSPSARHLIRAIPPARGGATLDLGCGSGVIALHAARDAERVVATDIFPRAAAFTAFNAALNGIDTIETLTGDRFEPVHGRVFDRILSNPPFLIVPSHRADAIHNPFVLDSFCRGLAREAPEFLVEGGIFVMTAEWVEREGEAWPERLAGWFRGTGCDAWVLGNFDHQPAAYAQTRMRETPEGDAEADDGTYADWMDYYAAHQVRRIHGGIVLMRKRRGKNWLRIETIPPNLADPFGDAILDGLAARDRLDRTDDGELLASVLRLSPDLRVVHERLWTGSGWRDAAIRLGTGRGLRGEMNADADALAFASLFDGSRTVAAAAEELARRLGQDPAEVRRAAVPAVRQLAEQGILRF